MGRGCDEAFLSEFKGFQCKGWMASISHFGTFCQFRPQGYLFMLGRSAASTMIFVEQVGGPENT